MNTLFAYIGLLLYRYFASLSYSSDGSLLLAGGRSRFVCLYSVCEQVNYLH